MHFTTLVAVGSALLLNLSEAARLPNKHHGDALEYRTVETFKHPGAMHTEDDMRRWRNLVGQQQEPWYTAFNHLKASKLAQVTWKATPQVLLVRGANNKTTQNYGYAYRDAHSAYQQAILWHVTGNDSYAAAATKTLNGWANSLVGIDGNEDMFLAAGLYGYQFANAGELLRGYSGWAADSVEAFGTMLNNVFAKYNRLFLETQNGKPDFYYANWDFCNIASLMAIGIFNDNATMYNSAVAYFRDGSPSGAVANGALPFFSIANFTEEGTGKTLMQGQEAGRDQGHALLDFALLGVIGWQGYNQGVDTFAFFGNQILNG